MTHNQVLASTIALLILGPLPSVAQTRWVAGNHYEHHDDGWYQVDQDGQEWKICAGRLAARFDGALDEPSMTRMAALGLTLFDPRPDLVGFYRFSYPADSTPPDVLESVLAVDEVTGALLDTYIQPFGDPDTYWDQQWNLTKARIDRAWTVATGAGEMVVAIIEPGGVEIEHEDFENAIWVNAIEMNGIPKEDDDRNGFVDDFYGWDFASNDNNPRPTEAGDQHGTAVAGTSSSGMPREQSRTTLR